LRPASSIFFETKELARVNRREDLQSHYRLTNLQLLEEIRRKPKTGTNILPDDIAIAYAYDINWQPLPIFQFYATYTSKLDLLNAERLLNNPPTRILYSFKAIDRRYPLFDSPAVVREILSNYHTLEIEQGRYILLEKNKLFSPVRPMVLRNVTINLNQQIRVPRHGGAPVYARIQLEFSALGKLANLFFKVAPPLKIWIFPSGGLPPVQYRFERDLARNGLFMSTYIDSNEALVKLISGAEDLPRISRFAISTTNIRLFGLFPLDQRIFYENSFPVTFFTIEAKP
jgi:hypothetical protein